MHCHRISKNHAPIAVKPINMGAFIDTFDWQHSVLLGGAILGGLFVGVGILKESEKWSVAAILVLIGVIIEPIFTIGLFLYDESISRQQKWEILAAKEAGVDAGFDAALANNEAAKANERAAQLEKDAANAKAREAEAELALQKLKTPRTLGPSRLQFVANATRSYAGQKYRVAISQAADDGIAFWESLYGALTQAGWVYIPMVPGQPAVGSPPAGIPIAAAPGIEILFNPSNEVVMIPAALALGNAIHADGTVVAVNRDNVNNPSEDRDVIFIRIGVRVPPP